MSFPSISTDKQEVNNCCCQGQITSEVLAILFCCFQAWVKVRMDQIYFVAASDSWKKYPDTTSRHECSLFFYLANQFCCQRNRVLSCSASLPRYFIQYCPHFKYFFLKSLLKTFQSIDVMLIDQKPHRLCCTFYPKLKIKALLVCQSYKNML